MGKSKVSGPLTSTAGFVGNVTGNIAGTLPETTVQYAETSHTAAQVKTLGATPREVVPAPGAGKVIEFLSAQLFLDYGGAGFTETADNMEIRYTDGAGAIVSQTIECTGFIDQVADTVTNAIAKKDAIVAATGCVNQKLVLDNVNDEFGDAGTSTSVLRVKVAYRVHTTGF